MLSLHLIRSLNGTSTTWRAAPQQPQKLLVAKLRPRNQKESEAQNILLMSPGADTAYLGIKQEALHEQNQRDTGKSTSEMLSAIHVIAATG